MSRIRLYAVLAATALVAGPAVVTATPAVATTTPVVLVGSLQNELGCAADWDPACTATELARVGTSTAYTRVFDVPAGSYEFKVALGGSWSENYGAGGVAGGANLPLRLEGPAKIEFSYDDATHLIGMAPVGVGGGTTAADAALAKPSLRAPLTKERYYFVMADRFANGDASNDAGGLAGGPLVTGLDPTNKAFYHGGDLVGLTGKLDYIKGLGTTAIWLTPSFKNKPVQGGPGQESAGYHGYWITDFTQIDPHLGTNADMQALIAAAHAKGMKVFFDIITNHTADVIDYTEKEYTYRDKGQFPYKDATGTVFDDKDFAGSPTFPALDPATSFPYHPFFNAPAEATVKVPAWLNDPTMYHNRGDSTFAGESSEYGDFIGLDDLFTERPEVVAGMGEIYKTWVDLGIDGFRIDTVKHVNVEFWQKFIPDILGEAARIGNDDFFAFGEVYDPRPEFMSTYTTTAKLQATLDFGFQQEGVNWVKGGSAVPLRDLFAKDDWYTDADSNAYQLPTFLGNHDMGRIGYFLKDTDDPMARIRLANSLMFLSRGQPVTYYGDEQGFTGTSPGNDQLARQDMFATRVPQYISEPVIGGPSGSRERYDSSAPIYRLITQLSALRQAHPALADGAQIHRYASGSPGVYAFSRYDRATRTEYLIAVNNSAARASASFGTWTRDATFRPVYGTTEKIVSGAGSRVRVALPPLGVAVWKASKPIERLAAGPHVVLSSPSAGAIVGGARTEVRATVPDATFAEATFLVRPVGTTAWTTLGTDDNAPYRVFHDATGYEAGTVLEYRTVVKDAFGRVSATGTYAVAGTPGPASGGVDGVGPVTQPNAVSAPGFHNTEMGCPGDWQPECPQAQLSLDSQDGIWKGTFTIEPGSYAYKVAIDKSWSENYGAGGVPNGENISYTSTGTPITFYYDHRTHWVTSDIQGPIITAPGTFQTELGCVADWSPSCMRPWLQDKNKDGIYTWSTDEIPAGTWEFKVAHGLSWTESYGPAGGGNFTVAVPADGWITTITYDLASHTASAMVKPAAIVPDLAQSKAKWVSDSRIAWPKASVPEGADLATLSWRIHWGPTGSLSVDAESVTGGRSLSLRLDSGGWSAAELAAHPELADHLPLTLAPGASVKASDIRAGQDAVAEYDVLGGLIDATGIDDSLLH